MRANGSITVIVGLAFMRQWMGQLLCLSTCIGAFYEPGEVIVSSRTASCCCGQLSIEVQGETLGVGVCHCLACQQRTGSVFATLAAYRAPFTVRGAATEFVRMGDQGATFRFRFCPVCGSSVFHTDEADGNYVMVAVGAFADPTFPAPQDSVYECRRHAWVTLPDSVTRFEKDPP
jgi:hypothetical protein